MDLSNIINNILNLISKRVTDKFLLFRQDTPRDNPNNIFGFNKIFKIYKDDNNIFILKALKRKNTLAFTGRWETYKGIETPNNNQYYILGNIDYTSSDLDTQCNIVVDNITDLVFE